MSNFPRLINLFLNKSANNNYSKMKTVVLLLCVVVAVAVARSPIPQEFCPQLNCPDLDCPSPGYQGMTDDGCHTCTCCPGMMCLKYCLNGFKVNSDGCPICTCRSEYET